MINKFPDKLYHYCTLSAFMSIIQNKCIWLSDTRYTNDALEVRVLDETVWNALKELVDDKSFSIEKANELWALYKGNNTVGYISCFSEDADLLSQWRAYSDDGFGVAIGISFDELKIELGNPYLVAGEKKHYFGYKVDYLDDGFKDTFYNLIKSKQNWENHYFELMQFFKRNYYTKSKGFAEEKEWRIVYLPLLLFDNKTGEADDREGFDLNECKFRNSNNRIIPYYELPINTNCIKEIILGPKSKLDYSTLSMFLVQNGFKGVQIRSSSIPYI